MEIIVAIKLTERYMNTIICHILFGFFFLRKELQSFQILSVGYKRKLSSSKGGGQKVYRYMAASWRFSARINSKYRASKPNQMASCK
jgi:hypothetical protein